MSNIPQQFKDLATSAELYDQSEKVGVIFGLHIDQIGEMDAEIRDVLNGVSDAKDFSSHIAERLEIDRKTADRITQEVNKQIFETLKHAMQSQTIPETVTNVRGMSSNASLERAGNFEIEPETPVAGALMAKKNTNLLEPEVTAADHASILHGIENPVSHRQQVETKEDREHYEPLVDQLLKGPAAIPLEKISVKVPIDIPTAPKSAVAKPVAPKPPVNLPTGDPYREPIK